MSTDTEPTIDPARPFDPDALREKYRAGARQAPARRRQRPVRRDRRRVRPLPRGPLRRSRASTREPLTDEVEVVVIGGGFGGLLAGARLREAGVDDIRIIEKGGDFGGTWYWNRYPGRDVRRRVATSTCRCSKRSATCRRRSTRRAPEILAHSRAIGEHFDLYRDALLPDRGHRAALGRRRARAGSSRTNRGDAHAGALRGAWPTARCTGRSCPASRASRRSRATRSTPAAGTTTTPAATPTANLTGLAGQARRHHRHRRDGRAVRARTSARRPSSSTSSSARRRRSTCAPTARPIRSGPRASSPAGSSSAWTTSTSSCPAASQDEDLVNDGWTDIIGKLLLMVRKRRRRRASTAESARAARWSWPTSRRWSRSAPASTTIVAGPGDRRGAEAVLPPVLQAAVLPRRVPATRSTGRTSRWSTPRASGVERITETRRRRRTASSTSSTASSTRPASRSAPTTPAAPATSSYGRDGLTLTREVGRRRVDAARHAQPRLPQLLHHQQHAVRVHGELPAHAQRAGQARRLHRRARARARRARRSRPSQEAEDAWVRDDHRARAINRRSSSRRARPATTTTRASRARAASRTAPTAAARSPSCKMLEDWRADGQAGGPRAHRVTNLS